jgi:hypothetical protein
MAFTDSHRKLQNQLDAYERRYHSFHRADEDERPCLVRLLSGLLHFVFAAARVLALLMVLLLIGGAGLQCAGFYSYQPAGSFVTITVAGNYQQKIHFECVGPKNSTLPTFWCDLFLFFTCRALIVSWDRG